MTSAIATKRVIQELTPAEMFARAVQRATELRMAAIERANNDFGQRIKEAMDLYFPDDPTEPDSTPAPAETPAG